MGDFHNDVTETNLVFNVDHMAAVLWLQYIAQVVLLPAIRVSAFTLVS